MQEKSKDKIKRRFNRAEWGPREAQGDSGEGCLYDPDSKRSCCLGLELIARGVSRARLRGHGMPVGLVRRDDLPAFLKPVRDGWVRNTEFADKAAVLNDAPNIDLAKREAAIIALFLTEGIEVEFYGELFPGGKEE